jgi:hypothetical protein
VAAILDSNMAAILESYYLFHGFAIPENPGYGYIDDIDEKLPKMEAILEFKMAVTRGRFSFGS